MKCWPAVDVLSVSGAGHDYNELLVLNMVRAGVFAEITHGACAYNHDLHGILFSNEGEGLWRRFEHLNRNGNLYPTHGPGPMAHYMEINRDRFDYLVSMSAPGPLSEQSVAQGSAPVRFPDFTRGRVG